MLQGSILGSLLFNIYPINLVYKCEKRDIVSYTDDTTPYSCGNGTQSVIAELQITSNKLFHWIEFNHLKANPDRSHLLLSSKTPINVSIFDVSLATSTTETLLGIKNDSELSLASKKLHALGCISGYMSFKKRRTLMEVFQSQLYMDFSLIWTFHSRAMKSQINRIRLFRLQL